MLSIYGGVKVRILLAMLFTAALAGGALPSAHAAGNSMYGLSMSLTFDKVGSGRLVGTFHVHNFGRTVSNRYSISFLANPRFVKRSLWGIKRLKDSIPRGLGYESETLPAVPAGREKMAGATWPLSNRLLLGGRYCWPASVSNSDGAHALYNQVTCVPPAMSQFQLGLGVVRPKWATGRSYPMEIWVWNWGKTQSDNFIVGSTTDTRVTGAGFHDVSSDAYNQQTDEQTGLAPGKGRMFKVTVLRPRTACPTIALDTTTGATVSVELCQAR